MRLKLKIKIPSNLAKNFAAKVQKATSAALEEVAALVVSRASKLADDKLHSTSGIYKQGLQQRESVQVRENGLTVQLIGDLPQALEEGFHSFDIKPFLLRRATKFTRKGVPYVDVPLNSRSGLPTPQLVRRSEVKIRRVSANSKPGSWIHPGFHGVHILSAVQKSIQAEFRRIVKAAFKAQGLELKL